MAVVLLDIIDQIDKMLKDITKANGYINDIGESNKEEVSFENLRQFPAVNIINGTTDYLNPAFSESGKHTKTANIILDCYLKGEEDKQKRMINFVADLESRFGDDTIDGNPAFSQTANAFNLENKSLIVIFVNAIPFSIEGEKHFFGVEFSMQVKFRQSRKDPTVLNP